MGNVTLSTAVVPEGTCPTWIIALWPQLVGLMSANLNGANNTINVGSSTPAPADQDKPWIRTDMNGRIDKVYSYSGGAWIALHPDFPNKIVMWEGDISTIDTLDGGEVAPVTATTGPMWEHVTELAAKFPLGVGTLPGGTILAVGSTGGEENHVLTIPELPAHSHEFGILAPVDFGSGSSTMRRVDITEPPPITTPTQNTGSGQGHNTMPPYYALHFIRRTARTHYRI